MVFSNLRPTLLTKLSILSMLVGCVGPDAAHDPVPPKTGQALPIEATLGTGAASGRLYHQLALNPEGAALGEHTGYVVGIEKASRKTIGDEDGTGYDRRFLRGGGVEAHLDDPKGMFVTHILKMHPGRSEAIYNVYKSCGNGVGQGCPSGPSWYEAGWAAMEGGLRHALVEQLRIARDNGQPFSHLVIASSGWNNTQPDSMRLYRALLDGLQKTAAGDNFRPIFIGVTWPSWWDFFKFASFRNKGHDADEVGHTYMAWLLYRLAPELKQEFGLKVVVIGHSFGARLVSRGLYSRPLVKEAASVGYDPDLLVLFQGAFNVGRFLPSASEPPAYPVTAAPATPVVATWSRNDAYVLLADKLFSGEEKNYIGGTRGARLVDEQGSGRFAELAATPAGEVDWSPGGGTTLPGQISYVDATAFIAGHSDICDANAMWFLWSAITHYAGNGTPPPAATLPAPAAASASTSCYGAEEAPDN